MASLNPAQGAHQLSSQFWQLHVLPGVLSRFGTCSLTAMEQQNLQFVCRQDDGFLADLILTYVLILAPSGRLFLNRRIGYAECWVLS